MRPRATDLRTAAPRPLLVAAGTACLLGLLALALDHGAAAGIGADALAALGWIYFALLLGAPLLIYPSTRRAGWRVPARVALSLLPGCLFWLTELHLRLRMHGLLESLWLAASPANLAHLYVSLLAIALAELGAWARGTLRGAGMARLRRAGLAAASGLALGAFLVVASVPVFYDGHQTLFQAGVLPEAHPPGPLPPGGAVRARAVDRPPNVVFILSDDHRYDVAGYAGHPYVETPSLDRLAAEGVRFERAYATTSLCSPSRASFLTGTFPHRHGVWNNGTPWSDANRGSSWSDGNQTFFEHLAQAGYATAFIGKWHMPGRFPSLRGVDHFVTFTNLGGQGVYEWCPLVVDGRPEPSRTRYIATELTDRALAWMAAQGTRPFALVISHKNVHMPFLPDPRDEGRYGATTSDLPPGTHPWANLTNAQYVHLQTRRLDASRRSYAEAVASLDREIGRVLAFLDERGLARDTLFIYASDNGLLMGERGHVDKRWAYELSSRIPLLVRFPAVGRAGAVSTALAANVDVAPTILDAAGLVPPGWMQGRSLLPVLREPSARVRDALLYRYFFEAPFPTPTQRAVVTDRYKYIEYEGRPPELFDLESDPGEVRNLLGGAGPQPDAAAVLAARLEALEQEAARAPARTTGRLGR